MGLSKTPIQSPQSRSVSVSHMLVSLHSGQVKCDGALGGVITTLPRWGFHPLGHTWFPPLIVTGRIGTSASSANLTAPALNLSNSPLAVLRPPSGKITTAPPSRSHCKERLIAAGSLPSSASGHAPNHVKHLPTIGHLKAALQAR